MRATISFVILIAIYIDLSSALVLNCMGCDIKNALTACDFNYTCPEGITTCETIVSKVEGVYAITASCATKEKCGNGAAVFGLEKCDHLLANTECYHCCNSTNCNKIEDTLLKLPANIFPIETAAIEQVEIVNDKDDEIEEELADKVNKLAAIEETKLEHPIGEGKVGNINDTSVIRDLAVVENVNMTATDKGVVYNGTSDGIDKIIATDETELGQRYGEGNVGIGNDTTVIKDIPVVENIANGTATQQIVVYNGTSDGIDEIVATDETKLGQRYGEGNVGIGNDTAAIPVVKNIANVTEPVVVYNGTQVERPTEDELESLQFTTETLNVTLLNRTVAGRDEEIPSKQHALTGASGIMKLEVAAVAFYIFVIKVFAH